MLRISSYFESRLGRNDGNPIYTLACLKRMQYYFTVLSGNEDKSLLTWFADPSKKDPLAEAAAKEFMEKYGDMFEVDHIYPTPDDLSPFGKFDWSVWVDWGEDGLTGILPYKIRYPETPFAYWCSDSHILNGEPGDSYPYRLSVAKKAEYVFCAQKEAVEKMKADGIKNPIWLPHAFEPEAYFKTEMAVKKYDVCFVGHVNNASREQALDRLFNEFPNFYYGQALFAEAAQRFCESKIVFNIAMTSDTNMRVWETLGTGSFLLTNRVPHLEELLQDGKHCVMYDTLDEMVEKAKYYLTHDEEREKIAQAGYEEVHKKHTIQHRVNVILEEFMKSRKLEAVNA